VADVVLHLVEFGPEDGLTCANITPPSHAGPAPATALTPPPGAGGWDLPPGFEILGL
jgi:hypothetical protein